MPNSLYHIFMPSLDWVPLSFVWTCSTPRTQRNWLERIAAGRTTSDQEDSGHSLTAHNRKTREVGKSTKERYSCYVFPPQQMRRQFTLGRNTPSQPTTASATSLPLNTYRWNTTVSNAATKQETSWRYRYCQLPAKVADRKHPDSADCCK